MASEALYYLHEGLPRQAPGSDACTLEAIQRLGLLPAIPNVLDVGCGPGRAALLLAQTINADVTAIDIHQPYLDRLTRDAAACGLTRRIQAAKMSMFELAFSPGAFDVIWAEGSAYFLGIRESLAAWFPLLRPGGQAVFTELCWLTAERPSEVAGYWLTAYPELTDSAAHLSSAHAEGYEDCESWTMPESAWWESYLTPLEQRMKQLASDPALAPEIAESRRAIEIFRRYPDCFGYVFHRVRKPRHTPATANTR